MKLTQALAFAGVLILAACSSISTTADFDPNTDFLALRTFAWIPEDSAQEADPRAGNTLVSSRVTEAIERVLKARGYELVDRAADFEVGFSISVERGIDVRSEPTTSFHYGRYGRHGGVGFSTSTDVREYEEGTLIVDFVDPEAKKLIWRGTAKSRLSSDQSPEKSTKKINEAVTKILDQFPPR